MWHRCRAAAAVGGAADSGDWCSRQSALRLRVGQLYAWLSRQRWNAASSPEGPLQLALHIFGHAALQRAPPLYRPPQHAVCTTLKPINEIVCAALDSLPLPSGKHRARFQAPPARLWAHCAVIDVECNNSQGFQLGRGLLERARRVCDSSKSEVIESRVIMSKNDCGTCYRIAVSTGY